MALIDENLIAELIAEYGSDAILQRVDTESYDKFGEETVTYFPDEAVKVIVNNQGGENKSINEGMYNPDDKSFFIQGTSLVARNDIIIHRNISYKADNIIDAELENFIHVHEIFCKRI